MLVGLGPRGNDPRCSLALLDGLENVHIFPACSVTEGNAEDLQGSSVSGAHSPQVAPEALVHRTPAPVLRDPTSPSIEADLLSQVSKSKGTLHHQELRSLQLVAWKLNGNPSSREAFRNRLSWSWLLQDGQLHERYMTPVGRHCLLDGALLSIHPSFTQWTRGLFRSKGIPRVIVPPWNLDLVLMALKSFPFELLRQASDKFLTWKMAFLVAITSARHTSKMHALHHEPPQTAFTAACVTLIPDYISCQRLILRFMHHSCFVCLLSMMRATRTYS
jgi:hypothetical protein